MNGAPHRICRIIIRGRVQGVGYRAWTEHTALRRGVEGWVRNCRDGSVEAVFAGPAEAVEAVVEACRRGPRGARVDGLDRRDGNGDDLALRRPGDLFSVLPTG
jgi:acylphosphatase